MKVSKQNIIIEQKLETARKLLDRLDAFTLSQNDDYLFFEPWSIFHVWQDNKVNRDVIYFDLFRYWQFFHWHPDPSTVGLPLNENCKTIAEAFLKLHKSELNKEEVAMVKSIVQHPLELFEVSSFDGPLTFVNGLMSRRTIGVYYPGLGKKVRSTDYLLAQILPLGKHLYLIIACSPTIDRRAKHLVGDFQELINSSPTSVQFELIQSDLFNLFYDLLKNQDLLK